MASLDALEDPAQEAGGLACVAGGGVGSGGWHTFENLDVEEGGGGGYAGDLAGVGSERGGCEGGGPGAVALLILSRTVVTGAGEAGCGGLVNFGEVEGEVGGEIGVVGVDAGVEDGDADASALGNGPGTGV